MQITVDLSPPLPRFGLLFERGGTVGRTSTQSVPVWHVPCQSQPRRLVSASIASSSRRQCEEGGSRLASWMTRCHHVFGLLVSLHHASLTACTAHVRLSFVTPRCIALTSRRVTSSCHSLMLSCLGDRETNQQKKPYGPNRV